MLQGSTAEGVAVEATFHGVHIVEDGRITNVELFPETDLDGALTRFEQLHPRVSGSAVAENRAVVGARRMHEAYLRGDWAAVEALITDDVICDDRRPGFQYTLRGRDQWVEQYRAMEAIGVRRLEAVPLATRGDRLALCRSLGGSSAERTDAPLTEVLTLTAVDDAGRTTETVVFEPDDIDTAFAELDARYLAGEGARYAETLEPLLDFATARLGDWDRWTELIADEITFTDNRPAALGLIQGRDALVRALYAESQERELVLTVEAIDHGVVWYVSSTTGTSAEGMHAEWRHHNVCQLEGGLVSRIELFDLDDQAVALAAFERLRRRTLDPPPVAENDTARVFARYQTACIRQDWSTVEALLADAVIADDRRSGVRLRSSGRAAVIDVMRAAVETGTQRLDCTTVATRANRLALVRVCGGAAQDGPGTGELEVLDVVETDVHGRITHIVVVDPEDIDSAYAELDARYLAGEGAPYAETIGLVLEGTRSQAGDWERTTAWNGANDRHGALAAFEAHRRPQRATVADNLAAGSLSKLLAACLRRDWATAEALVTEDMVTEDRRAAMGVGIAGSERLLDGFRFGVELGVTRYEQTTIATRGDRIVLTRLLCSGDHRNVIVELLIIVEVDARGRIISAVAFDPDERDAAHAELDALYAAGEAAPFADTWTAVVDAYRRFNEGRTGRWRGGTVELTAFADVPDVRASATAVHGLAQGGALVAATASAPGAATWDWLAVFDVESGQVRRIETYPTEDFDAALARFEQLTSAD
jgi:ketosteroid isomerase-like protein